MLRPLYVQLLEIKQNGGVLDFNTITYEELYQLWWKETVVEKTIANLYEVDPRVVERRRHKWGMKTKSMIGNDIMIFAKQYMASVRHAKNVIQMHKIKNILADIHELSEGERKLLFEQLAQNCVDGGSEVWKRKK